MTVVTVTARVDTEVEVEVDLQDVDTSDLLAEVERRLGWTPRGTVDAVEEICTAAESRDERAVLAAAERLMYAHRGRVVCLGEEAACT